MVRTKSLWSLLRFNRDLDCGWCPTTIVSYSGSSLSYTAGRWKYDVFLSFRGENTQNNFIDHLYEALNRTGIYTFKDDENLQRWKPISLELLKAISCGGLFEKLCKLFLVFERAYEDHRMSGFDGTNGVTSVLRRKSVRCPWTKTKRASGHEAECIKQIVSNILSYTISHSTGN